MSYAIICDARKGHNMGVKTLVLVDRSVSKKSWWTSDGHCPILVYRKKSAADFCARRLRKNNARVTSESHARQILRQQSAEIEDVERQIMWADATNAMEEGWDGHKS